MNMNNLYLITRHKKNPSVVKRLTEAASKRNIVTTILSPETFDFTESWNLTAEDAVYRVGTDTGSQLIEKILINENVRAFYDHHKTTITPAENVIEASLIHQKQKLPIIKTVFSITKKTEKLKKYVEYLNGFPIILKSTGGSHGVGVIRIDSMQSLKSVVDVLLSLDTSYIMREYIEHETQPRLIVLGDKVLSSIEYIRVAEDFRSNAGSNLQGNPKEFDQHIQDIAVKAVQSLGFEFGGVDILINKKGEPFIAEVNLPCAYHGVSMRTGYDISGAMIDYLINK